MNLNEHRIKILIFGHRGGYKDAPEKNGYRWNNT